MRASRATHWVTNWCYLAGPYGYHDEFALLREQRIARIGSQTGAISRGHMVTTMSSHCCVSSASHALGHSRKPSGSNSCAGEVQAAPGVFTGLGGGFQPEAIRIEQLRRRSPGRSRSVHRTRRWLPAGSHHSLRRWPRYLAAPEPEPRLRRRSQAWCPELTPTMAAVSGRTRARAPTPTPQSSVVPGTHSDEGSVNTNRSPSGVCRPAGKRPSVNALPHLRLGEHQPVTLRGLPAGGKTALGQRPATPEAR